MSPSEVFQIIEGGTKLLGVVAGLIHQAVNGDQDAAAKLKRVEEVLSPVSPTEEAFSRADEIAMSKPSKEEGEG